MIRIKQNGIRAVIHPQTGIVTLCDALTFSLLDALTPPFSEEFPMGLRYSFAKYDSADLKRAYALVKEIYAAAQESPTDLSVRTSVTLSAAALSDCDMLKAPAAPCPDGFVCTVIAKDAAEIDLAAPFFEKVHTNHPSIRLELRCPSDFPYAALPLNRVYLECGDSGNVAKLLPLASHVILSCTCGADLIPEADRLYKLGYRRFSLLPTDTYDRAAFVADAEKLTREWIRIERNDPDARFVPFTFAEVQPGFCGDTVPTDTLPGYFQNAGLLSHITPVTQDPVVLAKCAECAIVLQAQRK